MATNTTTVNNLSLRGAKRRSNPKKFEIATPFGLALDRKDHTEVGPEFRDRMGQDEKYWVSYLRELEKKKSSKYKNSALKG